MIRGTRILLLAVGLIASATAQEVLTVAS